MANNNGLNVLDAITAAKLGKGTGGSSGGVTKEYVDTQVGAVSERVDDVESVIPSAATPQNPLATSSDVSEAAIPSTSTTSPLSTANGKPRAIIIYGKSEIVDGVIKSAGEGYAVVRLADLTWDYNTNGNYFFTNPANIISAQTKPLCDKYSTKLITVWSDMDSDKLLGLYPQSDFTAIRVNDYSYTTVSDFVASLGNATLAYQLADPTQGNCIAIKTDNGTGINGTMATFSTGTPLRGIPDTDVRDVMTWDGSTGTVTKNCASVDLGTLMWVRHDTNKCFAAPLTQKMLASGDTSPYVCTKYKTTSNIGYQQWGSAPDNSIFQSIDAPNYVVIHDTSYTDAATFKTAMSGVKLVYELATPTTEQLTSTENTSIAALKTYSPQTAVAINDSPEFEVEAYANTANGQAVADIQKDLRGQISNMITVSPLLTLTAAGWDSTTLRQTVTFAHDTSRRNVIDIDTASLKAWAAAGVYAVSETASGITFECSTAPAAALSFRVTSMEVTA